MQRRLVLLVVVSSALSLVWTVPAGLGQASGKDRAGAAPASSDPDTQSTTTASYIGAYVSDGSFRAARRIAGSHDDGLVSWASDPAEESRGRPKDVPSFVNLHPRERVVENYKPPAYARKVVKGKFFLAWLRDDIITLVYGRERALFAPQHLTTDSQQRVIVSDPLLGAVHVLDRDKSFRISAGTDRRLHRPNGVAVDAEGNIYVADSDRGLVVTYDRNGDFLREIGHLDDETMFHAPTAIAIDRKHAHLYLLDTPRDVLFMLDLQGNVLKRVGRGRGHPIGRYASEAVPLDLRQPSEIAVGNDKIVVLDAAGSRVRIMDLQCNVLGQFEVEVSRRDAAAGIGLGMDSAGNVYIGNIGEPSVRVYDQDGRLRSSFGRPGRAAESLAEPSGLWIDSTNRVYISDPDNHRVQVFQLAPSSPHSAAESE